MNEQSTIWLFKLLYWFCPDHLYEEIEGDLIQKYNRDARNLGERRAKRRLMWNVIRFFRPEILFRNKFSTHTHFYMLDHFFKVFFRTTIRNRTYSLLNTSGLAIGLACSIFTLLWVMDEMSYDEFHEDGNRIFSVLTHASYTDGIFTFGSTSGRLAEGLKDLPEVEEASRSNFVGRLLLNYKDQSFYEQGVYADASLFHIFTLPLVAGNASNPLPDNNSIVISEKLAGKYFKNESAIGKIIRIDNELDVRVTAVVRDLPAQSTLQFQFILPYAIYAKNDQYNQEWGAWTGGDTYVKLQAGANEAIVNEKISRLITHPKIWPRWGENVEPFLFPLADWRLRDQFKNGKQSGGRITYIKTFSLITAFVLLIACVNFMNLATARSINRAKEIGVRKVIGAVRQSITRQFLGESVLISFISLFIALGLVHLLLPYFNLLTEKKIEVDYSSPLVTFGLVGITLLTGLIAGSYPAFFLSSLRAINILKGKLSGMSGAGVRKVLVVFQFSLSVVLMICAWVVYSQIEYMHDKNLGFDKENVFYIRASANVSRNFESLQSGFMHNAVIHSVSRAADEPMNIQNGLEMGEDAWSGKTKEDDIAFQWLFCDENFLPSFKFDVVEGRNFSPEFPSDSNNYIITEEAARRMRLPHPLGEALKVDRKGTIIGVVKDFHSKGLNQPIQPVIISMRPKDSNLIFIRYEHGKLKEAMSHVQSVYKKLEPDFPLEYTFLDDSFNKQYKNEILISRLSTTFMIVALLISCLGLFGLASFMADRRIKEIGIRKVLGATVSELIVLLCSDFVLLVGMALLIGFPVAWWCGNKFLETYPFRIHIGLNVFLITGLSLLTIALITVSFQSAKAALNNPVKSLKSE